MKYFIKFLLVLFFLIFSACSSSSDYNQVDEVDFYQTFKYDNQVVLDGVNYPSNYYLFEYAKESDGFLNVTLDLLDSSSNRVQLYLSFDKFGNFGKAYFVKWLPDQSSADIYESYVNNSSQNFNFQLDSYDDLNRTVKGSYSGKVYIDNSNLNSSFRLIEGTFYIKIGGDIPTLSKPNAKLKFNGTQWHPTVEVQIPSNEVNAQDATFGMLSDDVYKIVIGLKRYEPLANHTFNNSNTDFFVKLAKFNTVTMQYEYFVSSSGNLTITGIIPVSIISRNFKGLFSFTATNPQNPSEIITITDGSFEKIFYY
jgi:hypothetical protein